MLGALIRIGADSCVTRQEIQQLIKPPYRNPVSNPPNRSVMIQWQALQLHNAMEQQWGRCSSHFKSTSSDLICHRLCQHLHLWLVTQSKGLKNVQVWLANELSRIVEYVWIDWTRRLDQGACHSNDLNVPRAIVRISERASPCTKM